MFAPLEMIVVADGASVSRLTEPVPAPSFAAALALDQVVTASRTEAALLKKSARLRYRSSGKSYGRKVRASTVTLPVDCIPASIEAPVSTLVMAVLV